MASVTSFQAEVSTEAASVEPTRTVATAEHPARLQLRARPLRRCHDAASYASFSTDRSTLSIICP